MNEFGVCNMLFVVIFNYFFFHHQQTADKDGVWRESDTFQKTKL